MNHTCTNLSSTTSAFTASSAAPRHSRNVSPLQPSSSSPSSSQKSQNRASNCAKCNFCSCLGHIEAKCFLKEKLMCQIPSLSSSSAAPASTTLQSTPGAPQSASITSASALLSTASPDAHISSWNADTGASAHMTFNCHWIHYMMPVKVQGP